MQVIYFILVFIFFYIFFNIVPKIPSNRAVSKGTDLILKKEYEKGLEYFGKGAMSKKAKDFTKIRYAFLELKFGDIKKAKKVISGLLNSNMLKRGDRYEAKSVWALICFIEGDNEQCEEVCGELYKNYLNTDVYCTLGYIYNITKSPEEAVSFNLEAYDYNSDKPVIADNLGQAYYLNGDLEKAYELYEKTMGKNPDFPEFYYNFALVLKNMGDKKRAVEMLDKALEKEYHNLTTVKKEQVCQLKRELTEGNE